MYTLKRFAYGLAVWAVIAYLVIVIVAICDMVFKITRGLSVIDGEFTLWLNVALITPAFIWSLYKTGGYILD